MTKLFLNNKYIEIHCDRGDTEATSKLAMIPYIHSNRTKTKFITTIRNIDLVLYLFRGIDASNIDKAPQVARDAYNKELQRRSATKMLIETGPQRPSGWLRIHQQLAREIAEVNDRFGFFYDTRTGKTPMSLQIVVDDVARNPHHKWLVLCPLILIENAWLEDAATFFPDLKIQSLHAKTKVSRLALFSKSASLYVANIESFISYEEHIKKLDIYGCFVDESSTMKSSSSKFGKAAVKYSQSLDRWYLLSGTPAPNGEWEYYRQLQSIDYYGVHSSWTQFKEYFFENVSRNPQYEKLKIRHDKRDELLALLRKYSLYVDKEDVLTTPGRDFIPYEFELPVDLKKQYNLLREKLFLELGDDVLITAPSTAAKLNKLNQLTSGFIIDTKGGETYLISDYRFKILDKLLKNLGDVQVIIWANYHKEFDVIKEMYGNRCGIVNGQYTGLEKNQAIKDFKSGKIQYLIANPASAGKGLTLTNSHISIYFSMNYSYEMWKQSIERIYGDISSQCNRCSYYILMAKGTVDKAIYNGVDSKGTVSVEVLNHLKGGAVNDTP